MNKMKYVVVADNGGSIILFPSYMSHKDFRVLGRIISAGLIGCSTDTSSGFYCYGGSDTLSLKCRGSEDQILLDMLLKDPYA